MTCVSIDVKKVLRSCLWLALWLIFNRNSFCSGQETFTFKLPDGINWTVSLKDGHLLSGSASSKHVVRECFDEYWLEAENGQIIARSDESQDKAVVVKKMRNGVQLECRNETFGLRLTKIYSPSTVSGGLRKTVIVQSLERRGLLHIFSRVRLAQTFKDGCWLYTPRQSWLGKRLLYGVRPIAEVKEPITSSSGWDNRFVVAFHLDRSWSLAHWLAQVDGLWVPATGVIAEWGKESAFALTYLPDGWRWRLLHCMDGQKTSASADYVIFRGDWYEAWALYYKMPELLATYSHLETMPEWCQKVKYGTLWNPPYFTDFANSIRELCKRLGEDAFVTVGVFGWSLDGDYETERPFLTETLQFVFTPQYWKQAVETIQKHPRIKVGLYIQGMLIDSESQCYREHPDWVIRDVSGKPVDFGFKDNPVGDMFIGNPLVKEWVEHHLSRIKAVCQTYDCGYIYLDGGGYTEAVDWAMRRAINFADCRRLNEAVFKAVRSTGVSRGLLINSQNAPFSDMSWLECPYFDAQVHWRETVDFCFDTKCQQPEPGYTLEPLYWWDNDRYLAMCIAFGFTPCGDAHPEKAPSTWRAIEAAFKMKRARLIYNSSATSPVWWRDGVPIVTFAQKLEEEVVVPVLNFSDREEIEVTIDLKAVGLSPKKHIKATVYQPLLSSDILPIEPIRMSDGKLSFKLKIPSSWRGITLITLK